MALSRVLDTSHWSLVKYFKPSAVSVQLPEKMEIFSQILILPYEAVRQPFNAVSCHSEPFGRLRTGSAKNLINLDTYAFEILRLTPKNDIVGQPLTPYYHKTWGLHRIADR